MCLFTTVRSACGHTVDTLVYCATPSGCSKTEASLYYTEFRCIECWEKQQHSTTHCEEDTPTTANTTTSSSSNDAAAELAGITWVQSTVELDARAQWSRRRGFYHNEQRYLDRVEAARVRRAAELTEGDVEPWVCWWEEGYRVWGVDETEAEEDEEEEETEWDEAEWDEQPSSGELWVEEEEEEDGMELDEGGKGEEAKDITMCTMEVCIVDEGSVSSSSEVGSEEDLDEHIGVDFEEMMEECLAESTEEGSMENTEEGFEGRFEGGIGESPEPTFFWESLVATYNSRRFEQMREERLREPF
ncbi:hypothetical protein B0I37DRAFT_410430 [Chaetomium sp. MPI-CAGE-AT-0009]|nr:hypothetical protein B0I37DRAFT_410430 [Chaetomium sp. MPI-CAGE-AT-0009]